VVGRLFQKPGQFPMSKNRFHIISTQLRRIVPRAQDEFPDKLISDRRRKAATRVQIASTRMFALILFGLVFLWLGRLAGTTKTVSLRPVGAPLEIKKELDKR
jgi:hypothetical protein